MKLSDPRGPLQACATLCHFVPAYAGICRFKDPSVQNGIALYVCRSRQPVGLGTEILPASQSSMMAAAGTPAASLGESAFISSHALTSA